jgi:hypothetical protein
MIGPTSADLLSWIKAAVKSHWPARISTH